MNSIPMMRLLAATLAVATSLLVATPVQACTRILYTAPDGTILTARGMDWAEDMRTNLWAFPRGMTRDGATGPGAPKWTSRYGSVVASGYDVGSADGMNEKGLVANLLYLAESDYGKPDGRPALAISLWAQYALDNFATVAEAVDFFGKESLQVLSMTLPNGRGAQLHLSLSDATGDSAILEYVGGKLVIHHGKQFVVMTNSPIFEQQLALNAYWQSIGGLTFLPGTDRAADRFARASFLLGAIPRSADGNYISAVPDQKFQFQALASVLGVLRSVGVPLGITTPGQPNISSTIWRTVSDQRRLVYYFDSATSPTVFWVQIADLDLREGAPVKKLQVAGGRLYSGNVANRFEKAKPFEFLPALATTAAAAGK
ncbi:MAG: linear amide C-N hydrolase [Deltaproteobacteria bacterium]